MPPPVPAAEEVRLDAGDPMVSRCMEFFSSYMKDNTVQVFERHYTLDHKWGVIVRFVIKMKMPDDRYTGRSILMCWNKPGTREIMTTSVPE